MTLDSHLSPPVAIATDDLPHAWGGPAGAAVLRAQPEDFQVDELLGFTPSGDGAHVLLQIRKCRLTTHQLAKQIAGLIGAKVRDVGYSGMKDRDAVTTQWFSVPCAMPLEPDWSKLESTQVALLQHQRHSRKLRRGSHSANRFRLLLRDMAGDTALCEQRLLALQNSGFPNYFGAQRFGTHGDNAARAQAMLAGSLRVKRDERGILLSALRSALFNRVLADRVARKTWSTLQADDVLMLAGTRSVFVADQDDDAVRARILDGDVHVTGPLCGSARDDMGKLRDTEQAILAPFAVDLHALEQAGVKSQRRALRAFAHELRWRWCGEQQLELTFTLEPGVFATSLVRELVAERG